MSGDTFRQFLNRLSEDAAMQSDFLEFATEYHVDLIECTERTPDGVVHEVLSLDALDRLLKALSEDVAMQSKFLAFAAAHAIDLIELGDQELDRVVGGSRSTLSWPWPSNISEYGFNVEEVRITLGTSSTDVRLTPMPPPSE